MRTVELESSEWASLLRRCDDATPFHHPSWSGLLGETYGFRAFALVREDDNGEIVGGLPVMEIALPAQRPRWVSLPFTDHCAPLKARDVPQGAFAEELDAARRQAAIRRLEIRARLTGEACAPQYPGAVRHVLSLSGDAEDVLHAVRYPQVRRSVGKALREGVVVRASETEADVTNVFYSLHLMTRRRLGIPIQPRRYFRLLWHRLLEPGLGRLFLAYRGADAVAGAIVLRSNGIAIYKYSASDHRARRLRANNLLVWRAIQWSIEGGATTLDLGRTDIAQEGLRTFKSGWGAREETLMYTTLGALPRSSRLRHPPAFVGQAIRHSPPLLCRALGEIFYRYAA
jgi:CelD/BcsL family acetyltransferase involved in cellulose biosynthesis